MFDLEFDSLHRFDITQFLEEYQRFPCLWKKCDPDFKNRLKRETAERYLLQRFNLGTIKELRVKTRSIRGTYNQERNKVRRSLETGIGAKDVYKPKLIWFDVADRFLRQNEQENESESNIVTEEVYCLLTETEGEEDKNSPEQSQSEPSTSRPLPVSNCQQHATAQLQPTASPPTEHMNCTNKKRKRGKARPQNRRNIGKLDDSLEKAVNVLKEAALQSPGSNEFTVFGIHVASQLQTLPLLEAVKLQAEIQSLITSVRVRCLQNTSSLMTEQLTTNCSTSEDSSHNQFL